MSEAAALRRKSALFRHIAGIATSGGGGADRVLLHLAECLDHEAAYAERQSNHGTSSDQRADGQVAHNVAGADEN